MNEYVKEMLEEIGELNVENPRVIKDIIGEGHTAREVIELLYDEAIMIVSEEDLREYVYKNQVSYFGICEIVNNLKYFEAPYKFEGIEFEVNGKIEIK